MTPFMDFVAASLRKARFWVILCPINFVGKMKEAVGDMAKGFGAELAARAADIVVLSKPVRRGVLFECLTQLHAEGVFQSPSTDSIDVLDAMLSLRTASAASLQAAVAAGGNFPGGAERRIVESMRSQRRHSLNFPGGAERRSRIVEPRRSERRHSLRVLLVDDNSASQQAMRRIIINAGMLCDVAGNGKEALAEIKRAAPSYHLVLMDLVMPELDGATATRFLREKEAEQGWRRLPVIGISATRSNKAACIAAGMDAWQGLTLVHSSAHPVLFLSLQPPNVSNKKCLR